MADETTPMTQQQPAAEPSADDVEAFHAAVETSTAENRPKFASTEDAPTDAGGSGDGAHPAGDEVTAARAETTVEANEGQDGDEGVEGPEGDKEPAAAETAEADEGQSAPKKRRRTARGRISELVAQKNAERIAREAAEARLRQYEHELETLRARLASQDEASAAGPGDEDLPTEVHGVKLPKEEDFFTDDGEWQEAKWNAAWAKYNRALARAEADRVAHEREEADRHAQFQARIEAWQQRERAYAAANPTYSTAAMTVRSLLWTPDGQPRNPALAARIFTRDDGVVIAHRLGMDPDALDRAIYTTDEAALDKIINRVLGGSASTEAGTTGGPQADLPSSSAKANEKPQVTNAPEQPPVQLTGATAGPVDRKTEHLSIDEYMAAAGTDYKPKTGFPTR